MAYPPSDPANNKADATVTATDHPAHHNTLANAIIDIIDELGSGPKGAAADLTARLTALDTTVADKQPLDADLTAIAAAGNGAVLAATTASFTTADETKLDGIESGATADQSAAEILTAIKTVDGSGSGLDADVLRGTTPSAFALTILDDADADAVRETIAAGTTYGIPRTIDPRNAVAAGNFGANVARWSRVQDRNTISKLVLGVGVASGNIDVAVAASSGAGSNAVPDVLRASSGSVACPASGRAEISVGASLAVGPDDWFGIAGDNATYTVLRTSSSTFGELVAGFGVTKTSSFPIPDPAAASSPSAIGPAILAVP